MSKLSVARQNFHEKSEAGINMQLNILLHASYVYQSMSIYFDRDDVALPGFSKLFKEYSDEQREHAEELMKYQNKRGGRVVFKSIQKPEQDEWGTGLDALKTALTLEKSINQSFLDLHKIASDNNDANFTDFIESEFLEDQVEIIKKLSDKISELNRAGPTGLGEYLFDQKLSS